MPLYDRVRGLPLRVEAAELELLVFEGAPRRSLVTLHGSGETGLGEDVTYEPQSPELGVELTGEFTLESFSGSLPALPGYRRWGVESAAFDLALRQAGFSVAEALGRKPRPVTFVVSTKQDPLTYLELYPALRFKLDASDKWTPELVDRLAATGAVDAVDLKGLYEGDWVDATPGPDLYRLAAEGFPDAWIEDPRLTPETDTVLAPHRDRITWDLPIHSVEDVEALPFPPRCLNSKPSRFGSLKRLLDFYDHCEEQGIMLYGGGQFELGAGRGQIQTLASLFHPDGPNDVAPGVYNEGGVREGLPQSPLEPRGLEVGFR